MVRAHKLLPCRGWTEALLLFGVAGVAGAAWASQAEHAPLVAPTSALYASGGHRPTPVLHPNPQSIFDGLRYGHVNVGSGNLTFQRRDLVAGRMPVVFARLHDSRIADNADFGPGWRLALAEEIVFDGDGATHMDSAGARRRFRAGPAGLLPHPPAPDRFGWTLEALDDTAVVRAPDGTERVFERHEGSARFLLRRIVGSGGATELFYRAGLLRRVVGGDGEVFTVSRRGDGRVASVSDLHGRTVEYGYDNAGRLLDVRDIAGHLWWHEYDAENRLTAALDPAGETLLRASYDEQGRVAWLDDGRRHVFEYAPGRTVVEAGGGRRVFEQDAAGATRAHTAPGGVAWRIGFDHRHRVESLALSEAALAPPAPTDAQAPQQGDAQTTWAGTTTFQHDDQDRLVVEDRRPVGGQRREYAYDDAGRLSSIATPEGPVAFGYEPAGSVVMMPPAPSPTFEYHTGPSGRIYSVGYGGDLIAVDWNDSGQVVAFHADGHSAEFARDHQGRVAQAHRTGSQDARYQRDALGFVARVEHADGAALRVVRDAAGNVDAVEWFGPRGAVRRWPPPAGAEGDSDALPEGTTLALGDVAGRRTHDNSLQAVFVHPPVPPQTNHGAIGFDEHSLVPFALDPARSHVPGLAEALRLYRAGAAFLSAGDAATRFATTTTPPEYRPVAAASALAGRVEEVVVVGRRIRGYIGCRGYFCRDCNYDLVEESEEEVCRDNRSYLMNSDRFCYSCPIDASGGGGGGGGGNVVRNDQDNSDDGDEADEEDDEEEDVKCGAASSGPRSIGTGQVTVGNIFVASALYRYGRGLPAELGRNVQQSIIDANLPREARLRDGSTANQKKGRYGVKSSYTFVGDTVVEYKTTGCGLDDDCCTTKFTGALDDGFWDVTGLDLDWDWLDNVICASPDRIGPNCEWRGTPYPFVPFSWTIEYDNPKKRKR